MTLVLPKWETIIFLQFNYLIRMQTLTTKQVMDQSIVFKLAFWGAITSLVVVMILSVIVVSSSTYLTCYHDYPAYQFQCSTSYGPKFCCKSNWTYCGDSNCVLLPSDNTTMAIFITMWSLSAICILLTIFVFIMFCHFRRLTRARTQVTFSSPFIGQNPVLM